MRVAEMRKVILGLNRNGMWLVVNSIYNNVMYPSRLKKNTIDIHLIYSGGKAQGSKNGLPAQSRQ